MLQTTDLILLQLTLEQSAVPDFKQGLAAWIGLCPIRLKLQRCARSSETGLTYVYLELLERTRLDETVLSTMTTLLKTRFPVAQEIQLARLEKVFERSGHSSRDPAVFHYVVEMDPDSGWMPELERWYDTEHMPGLAAVPGCIRAARLYNHDQGPLSLACYDLVSTQTLGSDPWLAVRGTPWSDIVRPHFTHTKRTMFEVLG